MKKAFIGLLACLVLALILNSQAFAHTLFMTVENNEDGTVTIQGMFSTGATGAGIEVRLEDEKGKVFWKGKKQMMMVNVRLESSMYLTPL